MSNWVDAGTADLAPGQARTVELQGSPIALVNIDGAIVAIRDRCTHDGWPLFGCGLEAADLIDGEHVVCPRHGARFCLRTGAALTPPAFEPLPVFPVRIDHGRYLVDLS